MDKFITYGSIGLAIIVFIALLGFIILKFYKLATKERAFVRTGTGGQKVVLNGGAFVLPGIHDTVPVNMKTLRLEVDKQGRESLITADSLRVDVKAEFYVRVKADEASVASAAQTLGALTMNPEALKNQVEAKFVDALRAVAVSMKMYDLNAKRSEFVQQVQQVVAEDIAKNGLELESVSLTALNQTDKQFFNPTNAFDAEGLLVLTRETEQRRKSVNEIEQDTSVAIETKNLSATTQQQELRKKTEKVKLDTDQEIATMTADQKAAIARSQAQARKESESADIMANREIETTRIAAEQTTQQKKVEATAAVTIAQQEQDIKVADKSKEQAKADAAASEERAKAVSAEEKVATAREVEIANRNKQVVLVKAEERAQEAALAVTVQAQAERDAAENRAEAVTAGAKAERDALVLRAEGTLAEGKAVAEALDAKNEAMNKLGAPQIDLQKALEFIRLLPQIIEQSVKPMEHIDSIKISDIGGLGGVVGGNGGGKVGGHAGSSVNLPDQVVDAAFRHRTGAPLIDGLLLEAGLPTLSNINGLLTGTAATAGLLTSTTPQAPAQEVAGAVAGDGSEDTRG